MTFTLFFAFRIVVVGLSIAIAVGGAALIVYGVTRLVRRREAMRQHEPGYSRPVESEGASGEVPEGFEDAPRWLDADVAPEHERAAHSVPDPRAGIRESRRGGVMSIAAGVLLVFLGVVLATQTWALIG
ncbi:hypothetical protein [Gulosibacter faecalis]|jgi:hypothetical protein|uniref:Uncharacterized protein n=1 Tax=Gulosibacter faecalis TaxID=272240 RepID=A0ABW5UUG8_9MICO|nr:hypothetical protein [Gulosibacter faecalis]